MLSSEAAAKNVDEYLDAIIRERQTSPSWAAGILKKAGVKDYLVLPYDPAVLEQKVERLMGLAATANAAAKKTAKEKKLVTAFHDLLCKDKVFWPETNSF